MKRILLATALVAATSAGAFAQSTPVLLISAIEAQVLAWVPTADLSTLTTSQYARLVSLFSSSDNLRSGENPIGAVKVILGAQ